jgi:hypothetical protein
MAKKSLLFAGSLAVLAGVLGCDPGRSRAMGDENRVIVAVPDNLWEIVADSVRQVLEPRILTVRDERMFELTQVSPSDATWAQFRKFRQVLVIGRPTDDWVREVVDAQVAAPSLVEQRDVWARNQTVTALVIPEDRPVEGVYEQLPELYRMMDDRYRRFVHQRMFASRPDTAQRDALLRDAGFGIVLPNLYNMQQRQGSWVFQAVSEMGQQLMRSILVDWREGVVEQPTAELALAWRDSLVRTVYDPPQQTNTDRYETRRLEEPADAVEVQGSWSAVSNGWPYGGPFMTRVVACPGQNRTYLLDAWVFAPGRGKYEYIIQFETLLGTFQCGA